MHPFCLIACTENAFCSITNISVIKLIAWREFFMCVGTRVSEVLNNRMTTVTDFFDWETGFCCHGKMPVPNLVRW